MAKFGLDWVKMMATFFLDCDLNAFNGYIIGLNYGQISLICGYDQIVTQLGLDYGQILTKFDLDWANIVAIFGVDWLWLD